MAEADLKPLQTLTRGAGTIRLLLTIAPTGRVEEVGILTTDVPPDVERELTRRVFATPFLPAVRLGNSVRSQFVLEFEP